MDKCLDNELHKFVYIESNKSYENCGYNNLYKRVDIFFCEKCLEYKEKKRSETSRTSPDWY